MHSSDVFKVQVGMKYPKPSLFVLLCSCVEHKFNLPRRG